MSPRSAAVLSPSWVAVLVALAAACGGADPSPPLEPAVRARLEQPGLDLGPADPTSDLLVLYTGMVQGFIEPCGCIAGQIGGIDRMVGYVEDELARHPSALYLDLGDLFARNTHPDQQLEEQLPLKARTFLDAWGRLGCAGIAVGENDLLIGIEPLRELARAAGVPLLCANLRDADGNAVFTESVTLERGGRKIGIFALLAPDLKETEVAPKEVGEVDVGRMVRKLGLSLAPWRETAERVIAELAATCDVVICASHMNFDRNHELAESFPELDLVLGGHWDENPRPTAFVKKTPVLTTTPKGSRVGRVEWWWRDPETFFAPGRNARVEDVSARVDLRTAVLAEGVQYEDMAGRELAYTPEHFRVKLGNHEVLRRQLLEEFRALPPFPTEGNLFSHYQVPMHTFLRRSELALELIDRYHEEQHAHWTSARAGKREIEASRRFVGAEACMACHPQQYEFWLATRHSRAIYALKATLQDTDAECIGCHTVGYRQSGGFNHPGRYEDFANVQCAACHGPEALHVEGGASYLDRSRILGNGLGVVVDGKPGCATCHEKEHDPHFEQEAAQRLALVACPPMEPPGQGTPELRFALRQGATLLEAQGEATPWAVVSDAYLAAGDLEPSLRAAEAWRASAPKSKGPLYLVGDRLLRVGRAREAESVYLKLLKIDGENAQAWLGYGRAIAATEPERAITAALEAFSLAPQNAATVRLLVESLLACGRSDEAADSLASFLELRPAERASFADLLARLPAQPPPP